MTSVSAKKVHSIARNTTVKICFLRGMCQLNENSVGNQKEDIENVKSKSKSKRS